MTETLPWSPQSYREALALSISADCDMSLLFREPATSMNVTALYEGLTRADQEAGRSSYPNFPHPTPPQFWERLVLPAPDAMGLQANVLGHTVTVEQGCHVLKVSLHQSTSHTSGLSWLRDCGDLATQTLKFTDEDTLSHFVFPCMFCILYWEKFTCHMYHLP